MKRKEVFDEKFPRIFRPERIKKMLFHHFRCVKMHYGGGELGARRHQ